MSINLAAADHVVYNNEPETYLSINTFYVLIGVFIFFIFMTLRGIKDDGVYVDNIVFGALVPLFSFYLSKLSTNGTVVHRDVLIEPPNTIIEYITPITNHGLGTFFELFGILATFVLFMLLYSFVQERRLIEDD